jgi:mannose-6-phosphate isomerase-like protein (cupin superfamily)
MNIMKKINISEVPFKHGTYGSKYLFNEPGFTGGYAKLTPGSAIDPHVHGGETEVFYFMSGSPLVKTGNESFRPLQGDGLTVSAGEVHSIINDTDSDAEMVFIKIKG